MTTVKRLLFWSSLTITGAVIAFGLVAAARGASAGHAGLFAAGALFCAIGVVLMLAVLAVSAPAADR